MENNIEKVCNNLNNFICSEQNIFNVQQTRKFIKEYLELNLNFINKNVNIKDIHVICDETNNPAEIVDINCGIAHIYWRNRFECYYSVYVFGSDENVKNFEKIITI